MKMYLVAILSILGLYPSLVVGQLPPELTVEKTCLDQHAPVWQTDAFISLNDALKLLGSGTNSDSINKAIE